MTTSSRLETGNYSVDKALLTPQRVGCGEPCCKPTIQVNLRREVAEDILSCVGTGYAEEDVCRLDARSYGPRTIDELVILGTAFLVKICFHVCNLRIHCELVVSGKGYPNASHHR